MKKVQRQAPAFERRLSTEAGGLEQKQLLYVQDRRKYMTEDSQGAELPTLKFIADKVPRAPVDENRLPPVPGSFKMDYSGS